MWQPLAHRPGAIPLRPLGLGDILDAAFRIIRRNAGATVGAAVLVAALSMLVPLLLSALFTLGPVSDFDWLTDPDPEARLDDAALAGIFGLVGSLLLGAVLQGVGLLFVAGMATPVTLAAAAGRTMTMAEAWRATRGRRWRLIGLALLLGIATTLVLAIYVVPFFVIGLSGGDWVSLLIWGVAGGLALAFVIAWGWTRLYVLQIPALMAEPLGVGGAIGRGFGLSRGQFWRIFAIAFLTALIATIGGNIISVPIGLAAQLVPAAVGGDYAFVGLMLGQAVTSVIQAAFMTPIVAVVSSLLYVDQRIRKEAFDVELMEQAGYGHA